MTIDPTKFLHARAFSRRWFHASALAQSVDTPVDTRAAAMADHPSSQPARGDGHPDPVTRIVRRCQKCWGLGYRTVENLACEEVEVDCIDCDGTGQESVRERKAFGL